MLDVVKKIKELVEGKKSLYAPEDVGEYVSKKLRGLEDECVRVRISGIKGAWSVEVQLLNECKFYVKNTYEEFVIEGKAVNVLKAFKAAEAKDLIRVFSG